MEESQARHPSGMGPSPAYRRRRKGRWILAGSVMVAVAVLTSLFAFGLSRNPTVVRSVVVGRTAPDFTLPGLSGGHPVRLAALRGKVVVVNFWASWCADCRVEHPGLAAAWRRFQDQGVVFLGIPFEDTTRQAEAFQRTLGGGWPQLADPNSQTAVAFGVYGVPETFIIGRNGMVAYKQVGPIPYERLSDEVTRLLGAPAT